MKEVVVIGGGLAGAEAAWQAAQAGARVRLCEMRPVRQTPAHRTEHLAEIVCSNSLKSDEPGTAPYLLKEELRRGGSLVFDVAMETRVPAGAALAVDRHRFAELITERIAAHPRITLVREEVTRVFDDAINIIAAGPLCSDALAEEIVRLTGGGQLYFYDAISPIVSADSINYYNRFSRRALRQRRRRLRELPDGRGAVRRLLSSSHRSQERAAPTLRGDALVRGVSAD